MKILLFKETQLDPFRIYHDPKDVTICNDGRVLINEVGNDGCFEFVHIQTELIECDNSDQRKLCILLYLEAKS